MAETMRQARKRLTIAVQRLGVELVAAMVNAETICMVLALEEYRNRAAALGISQQRAEAILKAEQDRAAQSPTATLLVALAAAYRALAAEASR